MMEQPSPSSSVWDEVTHENSLLLQQLLSLKEENEKLKREPSHLGEKDEEEALSRATTREELLDNKIKLLLESIRKRCPTTEEEEKVEKESTPHQPPPPPPPPPPSPPPPPPTTTKKGNIFSHLSKLFSFGGWFRCLVVICFTLLSPKTTTIKFNGTLPMILPTVSTDRENASVTCKCNNTKEEEELRGVIVEEANPYFSDDSTRLIYPLVRQTSDPVSRHSSVSGYTCTNTLKTQQQSSSSVVISDIIYSLKYHITHTDFDYICAQHLGMPLCYCIIAVTAITTQQQQQQPRYYYLDIIGRLNITGMSTGSMILSKEMTLNNEPKNNQAGFSLRKRFKNIFVEYIDGSDGIKYQARWQDKQASIGQQIFELQRGLYSPTNTDESSTETMLEG